MNRVISTFIIFLSFACAFANENLLVGGDVSVLQSYNDNNVNYYDQKGAKINDVLTYLRGSDVGWNALRVRLFVNPKQKDGDGNTDAQVCQDIEYVVKLCKRIKTAGYTLLLDIHYSDTWADPSNQWIPEGWAALSDAELETKVYNYTKEILQKLVDESATLDFIQVGNEISYGMLWSADMDKTSTVNRCYPDSPKANWERFIRLLKKGSQACRETCPDAKIVLHTERSGEPAALSDIYGRLSSVDYDIIGLSYYPFWHNSLEVLSESLERLAAEYPEKPVHIVETAYYYQYPQDIVYDFSSIWPYTPAGQSKYITDLATELKKHKNVEALYWWFPEENGNGPDSKVLTGWINRGLWDNSTHKALPGLYQLKGFLNRDPSAAEETTDTKTKEESIYYDLLGRKLNKPEDGIIIEMNDGKAQKVRY